MILDPPEEVRHAGRWVRETEFLHDPLHVDLFDPVVKRRGHGVAQGDSPDHSDDDHSQALGAAGLEGVEHRDIPTKGEKQLEIHGLRLNKSYLYSVQH